MSMLCIQNLVNHSSAFIVIHLSDVSREAEYSCASVQPKCIAQFLFFAIFLNLWFSTWSPAIQKALLSGFGVFCSPFLQWWKSQLNINNGTTFIIEFLELLSYLTGLIPDLHYSKTSKPLINFTVDLVCLMVDNNIININKQPNKQPKYYSKQPKYYSTHLNNVFKAICISWITFGN